MYDKELFAQEDFYQKMFKNILETFFSGKNEVRSVLDRVVRIRNKLSHGNVISIREAGERPDVVPEGCVNFAFIGNFAETPRDTVFTTEYSIRTAMEAVYTLLNVDRGVLEVWGSVYDIRDLLNSTVQFSVARWKEDYRNIIKAHRKACKGYLRVLPVDA